MCTVPPPHPPAMKSRSASTNALIGRSTEGEYRRPVPVPPALDPLLARPEGSGIVTDFDGTLSPIVLHPAEARPLPEAAEVLGRLAARYGRVGVVSGRP